MMRMMLRTELRDEADRLAVAADDPDPGAPLPGVRPPLSTSNGTSYANITRKLNTTTPGDDVAVPAPPSPT